MFVLQQVKVVKFVVVFLHCTPDLRLIRPGYVVFQLLGDQKGGISHNVGAHSVSTTE